MASTRTPTRHHAAALDERGGCSATRAFATSDAGVPPSCWPGSRASAQVGRGRGRVDRLLRRRAGALSSREHDIAVVEVNQPHAHTRRRRRQERPDRRRDGRPHVPGRQGDGDSEAHRGIVESIRLLRVARDSAVKSRSAALVQLGELIDHRPDELREQLSARKTIRGKAALCARLRPDRARAARAARRRQSSRCAPSPNGCASSNGEIAAARPTPRRSSSRPPRHAPSSCSASRPGTPASCSSPPARTSSGSAATSSFARLCGASPIPASSGKTTRHRLNHGGDRQANRALHLIAVCRLRYCARTRAYANRRTAEGKTKPEIIRCLKRYIAREALQHPPRRPRRPRPRQPPARPVTINCGAGPIGITPNAALDIYRNVHSAWRCIN